MKELNEQQKAVISRALPSYRKIMERAYTTNRKSLAIKAFCLECVGYARDDIRTCTAKGCPLWTHRPYQTDEEE